MKLRNNHYWVASLLLFLSLPVLVNGQSSRDLQNPNLPGIHTVSGLIFMPNRRPIGRGVSVRLSKGGNDAVAWTNDDGQFSIPGVANGTYTLTVNPDGDLESASQRVEIALYRGSPAQTFHVNIQLKFKPGSAIAKPAVIDAEMAGVPKQAMQHYRDALAARAKGDRQGTIDELLRSVAEYPDFAAAHSELGNQYQQLDQLESSEKHLRIAVKLKPDSYEAFANLGIGLVRQKNFEGAETVLREALKIKSDSAVAHFYLGRALIGQKRPLDAEGSFRSALSTGGTEMNEARRALANIYLQRDENEKALAELEAYLAANPTPADEKRLRETVQQIRTLINKDIKP